MDGLTGGFFSERDELRKKYNAGEITFRQYEQKVLVRTLVHGVGMVASFAVAGPVFGIATKLGGTVAAGAAISGVVSTKVMEQIIHQILSEKHKEVEAGRTTWQQALADVSALEIELALSALLGPGQAKRVSQESIALIKNYFATLSASLSTTGGKVALVTGATFATDSAAAGVAKPKIAASPKTKIDITSSKISQSIDGRIDVNFNGASLFKAEPRGTKTLIEAAEWYRANFKQIATWVENAKLADDKSRVIAFMKIDALMLQSAKRSLHDTYNGSMLNQFLPNQKDTLKIYKETIAGTGQPQYKKIYEELRNRDVSKLNDFEAGACFAAGTLVHTQDGLKPIEDIKVGDMVLSKHESGEGERAYKRVTKTFVHEDREVLFISVGGMQPSGQRYFTNVLVTPEHPIWVQGKGWKEASKVKKTFPPTFVEVLSDITPRIVGHTRTYKSNREGFAWTPGVDKMEFMGRGIEIDIKNFTAGRFTDERYFPPIGDEAPYYDESVPFNKRMTEPHRCKTTVYNIEVEDFHTYYVTADGIWVHNKNITFKNPANGSPLSPAARDNPFITSAELYAYLRKNQIYARDGEYFIIRSKAASQEAKGLDRNSPEYAELEKWLRHEENVANRMVAPDGSTFEYALPIFDPLFASQGSKFRFLAVEGRLNNTTWLDRKLSLVKAGDEDEALQLIYRTALRLKANPQESMIYQFNPAKNAQGEQVKSKGLQDAQDFLQGIKDRSIELPESPGSTDRMQLIREIVESGRIRLEDAPLAQIIAQAVPDIGPGLAIDLLSQQAIDALLPIAQQVWLDAGASPSAFAGLTVNMQELPAGFAAWTQGKTITLDTAGAGWGWYIDASPLDHSEFAMGDAANAWRVDPAEPNNPAKNRLDLLTVLIHELGHVAGLDHSDDHTDIMSQYLAPGQRRLLSSEDVAALNPQHYLQTVMGVSTDAVGASSYAALIVPSQWQSVHSTLSNGSFIQGLSGWESFGQLQVEANQTITLGESTTTQTHLAQAFVLSAQDRFLTFNVSNLALQNNSTQQNGILQTAPQDAFEVALTHANTGQNLLPALTTNHSDALLNIQLASSDPASTVQERSAAGLRHTDNADGSRTYVFDLSSIAAGTPVNLSFDLIGFGMTAAQLGSHVSIKDVRLISTPVAGDDAATLSEDNSITINTRANDLSFDAPGFMQKIVTAAQHGQVSLNPDGTFGYTPDANFYGTDSFTKNSDVKMGAMASVSHQPSAARNIGLRGRRCLMLPR